MIFDEYFDKVVLIAMDPAGERAARAAGEMVRLGLSDKTEIVRGMPGNEMGKPGWWPNGRGAWGCYLSHLALLMRMKQEGWETLLLLEEDVVFQEDTATLLPEVMASLPSDWTQLYLGGQHRVPPHRLPGTPALVRGSSIHRTHAYAVHRKGLNHLIAHLMELPAFQQAKKGGTKLHIDHHYEMAHRANRWKVYAPSFWLAGQGAGWSEIRAKQVTAAWWHRKETHREYRGLPVLLGEAAAANYGNDETEKTLQAMAEEDPREFERILVVLAQQAFLHQTLPAIRKVRPWQRAWLEANWPAGVAQPDDFDRLRDYPRAKLFEHSWLNPVRRKTRIATENDNMTPDISTAGGGSPLFVFSSPRSGSTLLVSILDGHGDITMNGERRDFLWSLRNLWDHRGALQKNSPRAFLPIDEQVQQGNFPSHVNHSTEESWAEGVRALLRGWVNPGEGDRWWGMKDVHVAKLGMGMGVEMWSWLQTVMPDARIVFLTRDTGAVERSMERTLAWWVPSYGNCIGNCMRKVKVQQNAFREYHALNPSTTALVDYEDLTDFARLQASLGTIGVKLDPEVHAERIAVRL